MDETIIRVLQGVASEHEQLQLAAWRRASLSNERRFRALSRVWSMATADDRGDEDPPMPAAEELLRRAPAPSASMPLRRVGHFFTAGWVGRGIAAAALLAAGFATAHVLTRRSASPSISAEEFATGGTETVTLSLRDGSVVRLAPRSKLRLLGQSPDREVSLEGRAYFAIAKQPDHPFRIRTRAGIAQVLGTQFDLSAVEDDLRLVVVEGQVALSAAGERVAVSAGQVSRVIDGEVPTVVNVPDPKAELQWVADLIVFQTVPLEQAALELEHHYGLRVELVDSVLAKRTVSAWFSDSSLEDVLTVVCRIVEARCSIGKNSIVMRAIGKSARQPRPR